MLDQNKIQYNKVDLDKINSSQPYSCEKKSDKRFSWSAIYNIFNKQLRINFKWKI